MQPSESAHVDCPSCGEPLEITVDTSAGPQDYVEDCRVCCKPMQVRVRIGADGQPRVEVRSEEDA